MQSLPVSAEHEIAEDKLDGLLSIFNGLFLTQENTLLEHSEDEPLYLPALNQSGVNKILFAHRFFSSALHEISHWLVAGAQRRKLEDYGYWYKPDGRSVDEQRAFESVEILPQAIEWILSVVCRHNFHFSADNLSAGFSISHRFRVQVSLKAQQLIVDGLPSRMQLLVDALAKRYGTQRLTMAVFILPDNAKKLS